MTDMQNVLTCQRIFSRSTFGPDERRAGVIDHIRKELVEIETASNQQEVIKEWTDVAILAFDGLMRAIAASDGDFDWCAENIADEAVWQYQEKLRKNQNRDWPDWRNVPDGQAIEHVKSQSELRFCDDAPVSY